MNQSVIHTFLEQLTCTNLQNLF